MTPRATVPFGRALLPDWCLDPDITYLNHGTVGAAPRQVLDEQHRIRMEVERQPAAFLLRELSAIRVGGSVSRVPRLRVAAAEVGSYLGAHGDDLVFIDNATAGVNAVLRSLDLRIADEIAILDLAYGGIANAAEYAARVRGAGLKRIATETPLTAAGILDAVSRQLTTRTRVLVVDHITSESALVLPIAEIVALCRSQGVLSLVDGAHAPGSLPLDIAAIGADFYTANLHKWAWAPRSCGILWAHPEHQGWVHPPVISWGLDHGFTSEFDWVGTRDPSAYLAAPAAFRLMDEYGAERVRTHNHDLAWKAAQMLADKWGGAFETPESMIGSMATVPLPEGFGSSAADAATLRDALLEEEHIEVQVHAWRGRLWVRISAQIYNELDDFERLARGVENRA